jgi:hypothetical protein
VRVNLKVIIMAGHKLLFINYSKIMFNEFICKLPTVFLHLVKKTTKQWSINYICDSRCRL